MAILDNLVHGFKLDESSGNASDSIGSNTFTNNNTATFGAGKINNGTTLVRASNQYFSSNTANVGANNFTVTAWVKPTSQPATNTLYHIYAERSASNHRLYIGYVDSAGTKQMYGWVKYGATVYDLPITQTLSNATWYHVALRGTDNSEFRIYINGSSIGSLTVNTTGLVAASGTPIACIGSNAFDVTHKFDGMIDEVWQWDRALTDAEITTLYNNGDGLAYPFTVGGPSLFSLLGVG